MSATMTAGEALGFLAANPCECGQACKMKAEAIAVLRHALQETAARGPVCYFCGRRFADRGQDPDDYYCYGCREYVCCCCERNSTLCGPHDVGEHALSRSWDDKHLDEEAG